MQKRIYFLDFLHNIFTLYVFFDIILLYFCFILIGDCLLGFGFHLYVEGNRVENASHFRFDYLPCRAGLKRIRRNPLKNLPRPRTLRFFGFSLGSCSCSWNCQRVPDIVFGSQLPRAVQPCRRRDGIVAGTDSGICGFGIISYLFFLLYSFKRGRLKFTNGSHSPRCSVRRRRLSWR